MLTTDREGGNARELRTILRNVPFRPLLSKADAGVHQRGIFMFQTGRVKSFSWQENGSKLVANFQGDTAEYAVTIRGKNRSGVQVSCDCPYATPEGRICKHAVATIYTVEAIFGNQFPDNLYCPPEYWEKLRDQFFDDAGSVAEKNIEKPIVLIDLDAPSTLNRFEYLRAFGEQVHYWDLPPTEVLGFVVDGFNANPERAFFTWLNQPSTIGLAVKVDDTVSSLKRQAPLKLAADSCLDFTDGSVYLRRDIRVAGAREPAAIAAPVTENGFLLEDDRLGWIEPSPERSAWENAVRLVQSKVPSADPDPDLEEEAFELVLGPDEWNMVGFPWFNAKSAQLPVKIEGQDATIETRRPKIAFNVFPATEGVTIYLDVEAEGTELPHGSDIFRAAWIGRWVFSNGFERLRARLLACEHAALRFLAAATAKERKEIVKEVKEHPAINRIKTGRSAVTALFRDIGAAFPVKTAPTLHIAATPESESEPTWFRIDDGFRQAARAAAILPDVFPNALLSGIDFDDCALEVSAEDWEQGLSRLAEICRETGIDLLFQENPVESIDLDFALKAKTSPDDLDWFFLAPEVTADGSLIAQEKWEGLLRGGILNDQNGQLHVLSGASAETLRKFTNVLDLQKEEVQAKRRKKATELRVPRLRIFDWLALKNSGVRCDLPPEEAEVLEALVSFEQLPAENLPKELKANFRPYQREGFSWLMFLYRHRFGACLADDMGLGKTLQTIALLAATKNARPGSASSGKKKAKQPPHLVVLPPTLLFNWRHEIETFCPSLSVDEYTGAARNITASDADVILTTYEIARRDIEVLEKLQFNVVVFDEAQAIKNLTGERSKAMRRLPARFKVCLTGTPLENHAGEYYSILELALPGLFGDYKRFMGSLSEENAFPLIDRARPFVLRRTKEKILDELPPKTETDIWLDLTDKQKIFYSRAVSEVREEVFQAFKDKTAQQAGIVALSALTRLRQICVSPALIDSSHAETSPKLEYLLEKLEELKDEGHAALVFSQFTRSLNLVEKAFATRKIDYLRIDGKTAQAKRKAHVAAFQKKDGPPFFLISLKTGGVGLNLTRASYVFHLDPWWNPAVENQASDRAHRIGQKEHVFVNRLLMRHTVEEKMMLLKQRKKALFDEVMSGSENRVGGSLLTREDMAWLLEG